MTTDERIPDGAPRRDHERDVFSVPNVITVLRLVLIPVFYWFLVFQAPAKGERNDIAFALFFITAGTDWLDGWLARRTGRVTAIGKIIDLLVDRLLIASALIGLYFTHQVRLLLVMLLIGRDVYLLYGAWVLERHHAQRIPVTMLGKTTTFVLMGGFSSLIWRYPLVHLPVVGTLDLGLTTVTIGGTRPLGIYIVYVGVLLSLTAAVQYTIIARRSYRAAIAAQRSQPVS
jgi:cardiolipin synthase